MTTVMALVNQVDYSATLADVAYLRHHLAAAQAEAALWRTRYMATHEVLAAVEQHVEAHNQPGSSADAISFYAMQRAFLAYRLSIEAGAPLGWAVAEEEAG